MSDHTWNGATWHDHVDATWQPQEMGTWHESHMVWIMPPRACVHGTHGTWLNIRAMCQVRETTTNEEIFGEIS